MLITVVLFVALIALQAMELRHYGSGPSIWPPG
jgi:hypothetical protein